VNEPVELPKTEEPLEELQTELVSMRDQAPEASRSPATVAFWLRLAYAVEFLIALIAILNVWSEVGGQGHLDLMPWYVKLACILSLAWCCVKFTASLVEQKEIWRPRSIAWLAGMLLVGIAMGGITYYYHLHEEPEGDDEDTTAASVQITSPGVILNVAYPGRNG
jgi:hypothetical protein